MHQTGTTRFNTGGAMKYLLGTAGTVAVVALLSAAPAFADAIFATGNHPQPNEQNVMFTKGESGSRVTGTSQSGTVVDFASTTDTLMATANGQANLTSSDGMINNVSISVPGHTFEDFIVNPENGSGTADVAVTASDGSFSFTYALGHGNNFLTITTTGGETMSNVTITDTAGFPDLKQPRLSGVSGILPPPGVPPGSTVPEPSTLLLWIVPFLGMAALAARKALPV